MLAKTLTSINSRASHLSWAVMEDSLARPPGCWQKDGGEPGGACIHTFMRQLHLEVGLWCPENRKCPCLRAARGSSCSEERKCGGPFPYLTPSDPLSSGDPNFTSPPIPLLFSSGSPVFPVRVSTDRTYHILSDHVM